MSVLLDYLVKILKSVKYNFLSLCFYITPKWMFGLLFKWGVNVDARIAGDTLLHLACKLKRKKIIRYLMEKGANLHAIDRNGDTAFAIVCRSKNLDILKIILELGDKALKSEDIISAIFLLHLYSRNIKNEKKPNKVKNVISAIYLLYAYFRNLKNEKKLNKVKDILNEIEKYKINYYEESYRNKRYIEELMLESISYEDIIVLRLLVRKFKIDVDTFEFTICSKLYPKGNEYLPFNGGLIETALLFNKILIFRNLMNIYLKEGSALLKRSDLLSLAILNKNEDIINIILQKVPSMINLRDRKGMTPLVLASSVNDLKIVKLLIENGADVKLGNSKRETALLYAYKNNNEEMINELMKNGLNLYYEGNDNETILIHSIKENKDKDVKELLEREDINVNAKDNDGKTALIHATDKWQVANIKELLEREDINVNAKDNDGKTALMHAVTGNLNDNIERLLLEREDIDINEKDNDGKTALMHAVIDNRNDAVVELLLRQEDIDVNQQDNDGKTALMYAIKVHRTPKIIKLLLGRHDINVNEKDNNGKTVVDYCLDFMIPNRDLMEILLNREDIEDDTRLVEYAKIYYKHDKNISKLIKEKTKQYQRQDIVKEDNKESEEHIAEVSDKKEGIKIEKIEIDMANEQEGEIREDKINERHKCEDGNNKTILMEMAEKGYYNIVKRYIETPGIDLSIKDNFGDTALHYAVCSGNLETVKLFKDKGLNINITNGSGDSLLMLVIKKMGVVKKDREREGLLEVAEYLIEEGIDLSIKNYFGKTALDHAQKYNNTKIMELINTKGDVIPGREISRKGKERDIT